MYSEREGRGRGSPRERKRGTSRGTLSRDRTAACRTLARSTRADVAGNSAVANKAHLTSGVVGGRWSVDGHGVLLLSLARPRGSGCSLGVLGAGCCAHYGLPVFYPCIYSCIYAYIQPLFSRYAYLGNRGLRSTNVYKTRLEFGRDTGPGCDRTRLDSAVTTGHD